MCQLLQKLDTLQQSFLVLEKKDNTKSEGMQSFPLHPLSISDSPRTTVDKQQQWQCW